MFILKPSKDIGKLAHIAQADKVRKSILYLTDECIKKLKLNDSKILLIASELPKIKVLSPEMHFLHYALQNAMRKQNIVGTRKYLALIAKAALNNPLHDDYILISSILNSEWENFVITEAKRLALEDCGRIAELTPVFEAELATGKDQASAALCNIARYDPEMFDEIKQHVRVIKLFSGKITMGFTDTRILGAMLIKLPTEITDPVMYFVEHIVHEASHIHLNCLMAIDPLILNSSDEHFTSPLRADPRPIIGVFHAMYVSARIARTLLKMYLVVGNNQLLQPLAETLDETIRGVVEIEKNGILTTSGQSLIASIKEFINSAKLLPEWKKYDFHKKRIHRYGSGITNVATFHREVA